MHRKRKRTDVMKNSRQKRTAAGPREKHWEQVLQKCLKSVVLTALHPRTCIQVVLQAVHCDGAVLAAALNAAVAALMDASIPMRSMLAAATTATSGNGALLVDPDASEELVRSPTSLVLPCRVTGRPDHCSALLWPNIPQFLLGPFYFSFFGSLGRRQGPNVRIARVPVCLFAGGYICPGLITAVHAAPATCLAYW